MIRILCVDISGLDDAAYTALYEQASQERKSRADRYRRREDALRCVTADALLRYALHGMDCTVTHTAQGKPRITGKPDFHYNLSHSGRWVVIAYGGSEVGVDVEQIRTDTDMETIAEAFFSPEERNYVREDSVQSRRRFFEVWTAKESYIKFLGTGLKKDLTSFSVLGLEPQIRLYHPQLDGAHCLCLCTAEDEYTFELLDVRQLL